MIYTWLNIIYIYSAFCFSFLIDSSFFKASEMSIVLTYFFMFWYVFWQVYKEMY